MIALNLLSLINPYEARKAVSEQDADLTSQGADIIRGKAEDINSVFRHSRENRVKEWFLLTGTRLVVAAVLLFGVFAILIGISFLKPLDIRNLLNETTAVRTLFSALLSGAILLVSIVVSINSIVFSQEITDIDTQQERISASMEFRRRVEESINSDITPARPAEFLSVVLYTIHNQSQSLESITANSTNDEFREHVETFTDKVSTDIDQSRDILENERIGAFRVLLAGLHYDYTGQLHAVRRLKQKYADTLADEEQDEIDNLIETLTLFATGREYFKSLYYKEELAQLSSKLLFVSLPVIVFVSYILLTLDAKLIPEVSLFGIPSLLVFVSLSYVIALAPYVVLTAYVIRTATITLRTLAEGPFVLSNEDEINPLDLEDYEDLRDWNNSETAVED